MRIERIRIAGFGPLTDVDIEWPEGRLLLVLDRNERGKTTLCEAIVAALYGLPRGRGAVSRLRDLRRPRSGAPLRVGLDLEAAGRRWSIDRDLDVGTVRIVDRERGVEATREFLRAGGRDGFGEAVTGGLPEALFRATAYVAQNVLDRDTLDASLTVELARIADSGGGEASVVRAQRLLEAARREMPEARTGATVSIETEIVRLSRRIEELRAERARIAGSRAAAAEASARLRTLTRLRDDRRVRVEAASLAVVEADRRSVARRLSELTAAEDALRGAEAEAASLAADVASFGPERLAAIDRVRAERGTRPESLRAARQEFEAAEARAEVARREAAARLGPALSLPPAEREAARRLLESALDAAAEIELAEGALESQWEELRRLGLAEELRRLESLPPEDRGFARDVDDERSALELEGVRLDRKVAEAKAALSILAGERRARIQAARLLAAAGACLLPLTAWLVHSAVPLAVSASVGATALALLGVGVFRWISGRDHRREDEAAARKEDEAHRLAAAEIRRRLSELRRRVDQVAHAAGFPDGPALVKAQRRLRLAEESRRRLLDRQARHDAARVRAAQIDADLAAFRDPLGLPDGFPDPDAARRAIARLREVDEALEAERRSAAFAVREAERLDVESGEIARIERSLREELAAAGVPRDVPFGEAFDVVEAARRRLARRSRLVEVEIPARRDAADEGERTRLVQRLAALDEEIASRRRPAGEAGPAAGAASDPEVARRTAEEERRELETAEAGRLEAERELASAARDGGARARDVEEALADAEALFERATLFRDGVDLAREALAAAASSVYGDFRRGLATASREILSSWNVPYEALEFGDDLSVSAVARDGRAWTRAEIGAALSTGAREQLHLIARLAVLRYLGTGVRGVPLLLDDPLTGTDDERFVSVMEFLLTRVLAERPVLLLSCHGWRHERLPASLAPGIRERLSVVSLSAPPGGGSG